MVKRINVPMTMAELIHVAGCLKAVMVSALHAEKDFGKAPMVNELIDLLVKTEAFIARAARDEDMISDLKMKTIGQMKEIEDFVNVLTEVEDLMEYLEAEEEFKCTECGECMVEDEEDE